MQLLLPVLLLTTTAFAHPLEQVTFNALAPSPHFDAAQACPNPPAPSCPLPDGVNSCCTNTPGAYFVQTQFWDTNPVVGPVDSWTVHGLWPDHCDGVTFDVNCDQSRMYHNITEILQSFNQTEMIQYMSEMWLPNRGSADSFWEHEWNKVRPAFTFVRNEFKSLPTYNWLADAGIIPSTTATYTLEQLQAVARDRFGFETIWQCQGNQLQEVWWGFTTIGSVMTGTFVPSERGGARMDCPATGIRYLPKTGTRPSPTTPGGPAPTPTGAPSGRVFLNVVLASSGSAKGCLISNGKWFTSGSCAGYTVSNPLALETGTEAADEGFTLSTTKGPCQVTGQGAFACGGGLNPTTFTVDDSGDLVYAKKAAFYAPSIPSGTKQVDVLTGRAAVEVRLRWGPAGRMFGRVKGSIGGKILNRRADVNGRNGVVDTDAASPIASTSTAPPASFRLTFPPFFSSKSQDDKDLAFVRSLQDSENQLHLSAEAASAAYIESLLAAERAEQARLEVETLELAMELEEEEKGREERRKVEEEEGRRMVEELTEREENGVVVCEVCFDEVYKKGSVLVQCGEGHVVCQTCALEGTLAALSNLDARLACLADADCTARYSDDSTHLFLSHKEWERVEKLRMEKDIEAAGEGVRMCPHCPYAVVIEDEAMTDLECRNPECLKSTCLACKRASHAPVPCAIAHPSAMHQLEEAMSNALIRECPGCKKKFVKRDGCNRITCVNCGVTSCYLCRAKITGYDHFNKDPGPCNGKCFDSKIVDREVEGARTARLGSLKGDDRKRAEILKIK
ncbi:hypothetical protein MNV49_004870 [Pseudohyphozyma bogoriensis]|nr:hypothetical protein MNV49_004870 [Pseudohyphozyma bogoriensis]